jgi:hypothetical protein
MGTHYHHQNHLESNHPTYSYWYQIHFNDLNNNDVDADVERETEFWTILNGRSVIVECELWAHGTGSILYETIKL